MQTETGKKSWSTEQKRTPEAKLEIERTKSYCDKMWAQSEFKRWAIGNWNWVEIENWISNLETEWGAGGTKCGFRHLPSNAEKLDFPLRWLLIHNCCRITGKGMGCKKLDVIGMLFCPLNVFEDSVFEGLGCWESSSAFIWDGEFKGIYLKNFCTILPAQAGFILKC